MGELVGEALERKRGDTAPDVIKVTDEENGGVPLDVTGFSYTLTVSTEKDPAAGLGTELVQVNGTITDAPAGRVEFLWTVGDADQEPGRYWYDIEQVDASGRIKTVAKNRYDIFQDITKIN